MIYEGRINSPSVFAYAKGAEEPPERMRQKQKERLILLNLSVFVNWRFDVTEKESLTLFFTDGISPPSDDAKLTKIFD